MEKIVIGSWFQRMKIKHDYAWNDDHDALLQIDSKTGHAIKMMNCEGTTFTTPATERSEPLVAEWIPNAIECMENTDEHWNWISHKTIF